MKFSKPVNDELTVFIRVKIDNLKDVSLLIPEIVRNNDKMLREITNITTDKKYFESYNKFFIHGVDTVVTNKNIRVYNKIGQAYGTSVDNAYIRNYQDDIEFVLTATIYTNKNKTINDNVYEYDETAIPFLAKLSQSLYNNLKD